MNEINKAINLVEEGHIDEALAILSHILTTCSDDEKIGIAELYVEWGFFDEACEVFEQLVETYPTNSELKVMLSSIYIELERDEKALHLLEQIDEHDDVYSQVLLQQADLYESQGLYEVAEQKLFEAKRLHPDEIIIDFALGELLFSIGQYDRAVTFYERVIKQEEEIAHINIKERIAECLASLGQYETALTYYETIQTENPDTLFKHGLVAYYADRQSIAVNVWNKLIELDPYYHTVYSHLGQLLYENGQLDDAYMTIQNGLKYDEYNKTLYLTAAKIAYAKNDILESEQYIHQAIELDADYKEAILFLIELYDSEGAHEKIVDLINDINTAHIYDPDYEWELAKAYEALELYDKALVLYNKLYDHFKHNHLFLKRYGYFLTEEGLIKEAIDVLSHYVSIVNDDEDVILFLERLQSSYN